MTTSPCMHEQCPALLLIARRMILVPPIMQHLQFMFIRRVGVPRPHNYWSTHAYAAVGPPARPRGDRPPSTARSRRPARTTGGKKTIGCVATGHQSWSSGGPVCAPACMIDDRRRRWSEGRAAECAKRQSRGPPEEKASFAATCFSFSPA